MQRILTAASIAALALIAAPLASMAGPYAEKDSGLIQGKGTIPFACSVTGDPIIALAGTLSGLSGKSDKGQIGQNGTTVYTLSKVAVDGPENLDSTISVISDKLKLSSTNRDAGESAEIKGALLNYPVSFTINATSSNGIAVAGTYTIGATISCIKE